MRILKNRIIISFFVIFLLTYVWEFWVKPNTSPLYTEAVAQYRNGHYQRSIELLKQAYRIDPNDTAILTLFGWDYLKLDAPHSAEPYFRRANLLAPNVVDMQLGFAYTEIALKKYEEGANLLRKLQASGVDNADVHMAWATLYRDVGRERDAAREFQIALAKNKNNTVALKNLQELYNETGDVSAVSLTFQPLVRPKELTYLARAEGDRFALESGGRWQPTYLAGVDLTAALPGHFPIDSATDPALYADWFSKISDLGANTIRVYAIMPSAFYRSLFQFNSASNKPPLRLLQGINLGDPPRDDLFNHDFYSACQKEIRDTIDVIHGQGDVGATPAHPAGIYTNSVSSWVVGFLVGQTWLSHVVTGNNQLHADLRSYRGAYVEVASGSPTEIFLAQMINYAAEYEESKYNWQRPIAFLNWPTLDPMRHPTESAILEEVSIRRALGERFPTPLGPYDDDDSVSLDSLHLRATARFPAGIFAAYSVFPYYPDFINREPQYQQARDSEGTNPFLGYLQDLKAHTPGIPLLITDYGIPTSLGIGHFSPAGFDQGGKAEEQQGELLARFTGNIQQSGGAGGMVFEWLDEWFRQMWLVRNFEVPPDRKPLWADRMDPAEYFGLLAVDPHRSSVHRLSGERAEWENAPPLYSQLKPQLYHPVGDRFDPARELKALYADADEAFLYLRLVLGKLDNDGDGQPDWKEVNYLIGISTSPGQAGLKYLPFIAPLHFPMGMTYAIQLAGPEESRIWVASSYDPYQITPVEGVPSQTVLSLKLGWRPSVTENGSFEAEVLEPNRRRFGRDGKYFPPQRHERGILRYGSLSRPSPEYDPLAEWHANVQTNTIDLRIPWNLLNVTDPSSFQVVAGLDREGGVETTTTPGFLMVAFSYRPLEEARIRPIMEQGHPVADALPGMAGPVSPLAAAYKNYRWPGWDNAQYALRLKDSYAILRKAFLSLSGVPATTKKSP